MLTDEWVDVESIAARTKDSGTIILPCEGAGVRGVLERMVALEIPCRPKQQNLLRKAFTPGSRVHSLVLLCARGQRIHLLAPEVVRMEERASDKQLSKQLGPAGDVPRTKLVVVMRVSYSRQSG